MSERLGVRGALDIMAAIAMMSVSIFLFWKLQGPVGTRGAAQPPVREVELPSAPVSLNGLQQVGSMSAAIVVIEYSDFECPYCARFATGTWPQVRRDYVDKGLVRVAFSQFPIDGLHQSARRAAEVSECAGEDGHFWEVHDLFFAKQAGLREILREPNLGRELRSLGVNAGRFTACMAGEVPGRIDQMSKTANALEITGTPTFLVGLPNGPASVRVKRRLEGAVSFTAMGAVIDTLIKESALVK